MDDKYKELSESSSEEESSGKSSESSEEDKEPEEYEKRSGTSSESGEVRKSARLRTQRPNYFQLMSNGNVIDHRTLDAQMQKTLRQHRPDLLKTTMSQTLQTGVRFLTEYQLLKTIDKRKRRPKKVLSKLLISRKRNSKTMCKFLSDV